MGHVQKMYHFNKCICLCIVSVYDTVCLFVPVSHLLCPHLSVCVASSAFRCVCICHSASVVWWLRLWFLSSQHSSKYSDKTQRTPRSLRPGQSIREKTTQRSGCFCSIKQPSEQQQPFSVWDVELILARFLFPDFSLPLNHYIKNCHESCGESCKQHLWRCVFFTI